MLTDIMAILQTNDNGTFFDPTLLEHIRLKNNAEIFLILKEVNPCHLTDSAGTTLLHFAAEYGNSEFAQYLIDSGVDVNVQNQMKETPLMLAVFSNRETVRLLLKANADLYIPDVNGQCALGKAVNNRMNFIAVLNHVTVESLKNSKHVSSDAFHRDCPLYYFMWRENAEITQILLDYGSPVDAKEPICKETALFTAVEQLDLDNIKLLLKYNADVNAKDHSGKTPLAHITPTLDQNKALEAVKILLAAGAILIDYTSRKTMLYELLANGSKEIVRTLLQCEIDLMFENNEGLTPLHFLAYNKHSNIFQELSHLNFDISVRCRLHGRTILHNAIRAGNTSSVEFLLDHGANINDEDFHLRTPLYNATNPAYFDSGPYTDSHLNGYMNCVEILLERGANPYTLTEQNRGWNIPHPYRYNMKDEFIKVITPLFARLAILEASDRPIGTFMRDQINSYERIKDTFDMIKRQVEEMKQIEIDSSVSLFDFLTVDKDKVPRFARKKGLVSNLTNVMKDYSTETYFGRKLHERFLKFSELVEWRESLVFVLNEVLTAFYNLSVSNIAEKIVDCLQDEKWKEIM